jgi:hypothetical protein
MATTIKTRFRMQVGREAPIADANGYYTMKDPVDRRFSPLGKDHDVEAVPLIPGTPYFALIRLSDDKGVWQFIKHDFATLKRKITIQWKKFKVWDDGDFDLLGVKDKGDDAEIAFSVYQIKNSQWQNVQRRPKRTATARFTSPPMCGTSWNTCEGTECVR